MRIFNGKRSNDLSASYLVVFDNDRIALPLYGDFVVWLCLEVVTPILLLVGFIFVTMITLGVI